MSFEGLPSTTWWLVRMRPLASKMTPDPIADPVPVWPVVGSVEAMPSAWIVTTAGLTVLTMSTSGADPVVFVAGGVVDVEAVVVPPASAGVLVG